MDVTDHPDLGALNAQRLRTVDLKQETLLAHNLSAHEDVLEMIEDLDDSHLRKDIAKLSSFWNRSYRSAWGLASSNWVYDTIDTVCLPPFAS